MSVPNIPENLLGAAISFNFTYACKWCASTVQVVEGESQPHACRIEVVSV